MSRNRPLSWNRYSHVEGDPVNYNDPAGLFSCLVGSITTTAFGVTSTTLLWEECPSFLMPSPLPTGLTSARMSLGWLAMQWNDTHPHRNPGDKRLRTGLECQDDVINAMNDAWMRSGKRNKWKGGGLYPCRKRADLQDRSARIHKRARQDNLYASQWRIRSCTRASEQLGPSTFG